ncbi:MAG: divergent polysaccharide deacetylase family protein [Nitrospinae bacterium]|nr:divergent polysaccharide deacetylase family protein [Nitrospinota bacterium]MBI3812875.1 divergent polysaccharide deacetylase family protein [Nitrospinota bacterium]
MTDGNSKLWAVVFTIIITLSISLGILWYKQDKNKEIAFKYEIYDHVEDTKPDETNTVPPPPPLVKEEQGGIKVAIIIDDLGWNKDIADELLNIAAPISFSILPHLPFSKIIAEEAGLKNRDVLLHLPMEAHGYSHEDQGLKPLTDKMNKDDIESTIKDYISSIPHIVGVNNHMGSKFTESGEAMKYLMEIVKSKNLFFVDSRTTPKSLAYQTAKSNGVKTARRNVFLDNKEDEEYIKGQIEELIKSANRNGFAIGIGHPHPQTIAAIQKMISVIKEKGIEIVPVSELVN